jgi:hypothetical protein
VGLAFDFGDFGNAESAMFDFGWSLGPCEIAALE